MAVEIGAIRTAAPDIELLLSLFHSTACILGWLPNRKFIKIAPIQGIFLSHMLVLPLATMLPRAQCCPVYASATWFSPAVKF